MTVSQRLYSRAIFLTLLIAVFALAANASAGHGGTAFIRFHHYVAGEALKLDSVNYKNKLGQPFTVSRLRYYVSNIRLMRSDGKRVDLGGYFLIDEEDSSSKDCLLRNVPEGSYTTISFTVGVDSLHNCSGVQDGALDPALGMFWAWNTGYIFFKLEGHSVASLSPGHLLEYHIGGYKAPANCIREVTIAFENSPLVVPGAKPQVIHIKTDISRMLDGDQPVDFSRLSSVTDFHNVLPLADKMPGMFSLLKEGYDQ